MIKLFIYLFICLFVCFLGGWNNKWVYSSMYSACWQTLWMMISLSSMQSFLHIISDLFPECSLSSSLCDLPLISLELLLFIFSSSLNSYICWMIYLWLQVLISLSFLCFKHSYTFPFALFVSISVNATSCFYY